MPIILVAGAVISCSASEHGHTQATPSLPAPSSAASPVVSSQQQTPPAAEWHSIGTSVQNRPIRVLTLGHGPRRVLFIGGIHGDEAEGAYTTAQLPAAFHTAGLDAAVTLTIIEDANPDGRAAATRGNANGVDVNRNFPASNFDASNPVNGGSPLSQPESRAVFDAIERLSPDLVIVSHAWVDREFINFDGPARTTAERFSADSGLPIEESNEFAATPGSLGSYLGRDRGKQLLTIEVRKGTDPRLVWDRLNLALLNAIRG
ncbi:M14 family zinc carboxypeptidase [Mycolicibacterium sphagni]|uniref:M14 family zinc carboxypeptidase n=1 Tax=Mycolicibacterium sphagni TaxID=1786 RepID=UPI0021F37C52|nr:M14 family zinc carboxypeptidase [Mycolicibacterium sphagni]MCV7176166.1 DUF2817 domain-containing protein [Mycolicibacterium sphagni]